MIILKLYTVCGNLATLNNGTTALFNRYDDNPLGLPANTVRVRTSDGNAPIRSQTQYITTYETATLVEGTTDVYDVYKSGELFSYLLAGSTNVVEVLGANTTGITNMIDMFIGCTSLTTVPLFDTSNVTNMREMFFNCNSLKSIQLFDTSNVNSMRHMFYRCTSLKSIPLFDTSNVTRMEQMFIHCTSLTSVPLFDTSNVWNMLEMCFGCVALTSVPLFDTSNVIDMRGMFNNCSNVQSGALALYQQASTQTAPPDHIDTFRNCGSNTVQGAAELAQIPTSWGGTMQE